MHARVEDEGYNYDMNGFEKMESENESEDGVIEHSNLI